MPLPNNRAVLLDGMTKRDDIPDATLRRVRAMQPRSGGRDQDHLETERIDMMPVTTSVTDLVDTWMTDPELPPRLMRN